MEHHFCVDIFYATIDSQLQELNEKFKENMVELLMLCSALDPRDDYKSFNIDKISTFERAFFAIKIVRTKHRNKMEDYLESYLITYIEKEIAQTFEDNSIIDDFYDMKERKLQFKMPNLFKKII
ncbi:hypothetical protein J1N35_021197 [Gossypium stocksii]|uniref:Uncharacterized protein n=1 Tax=Gossypium stocksii TaxID=47602 RepID=A0A9D3VES1_9ROSI|nr:hypothetical protein J1N35_021197 [Gossypium stocksii]